MAGRAALCGSTMAMCDREARFGMMLNGPAGSTAGLGAGWPGRGAAGLHVGGSGRLARTAQLLYARGGHT